MKFVNGMIRGLFQSLGYDLVRRTGGSELITPNPVTSLLSESKLVEVSIVDCVDKLGINYEQRHPWVITVNQQISKNDAFVESPQSSRFFENWRFPLVEEVFSHLVPKDKIGRHFLRVFHGGWAFLPFSNVSLDSVEDRIISATKYLVSEAASAGVTTSIDNALNDDGTWSQAQVEVELHRLWKVSQSIRDFGYKPSSSPDGDILVYALRRGEAYRFLVVSGYHRVAVLAAMGFETVRVRLFRPLVLDATAVNSWPGVKQGVYSPAQALAYFNHLFDHAPAHFDSAPTEKRN